jgi:hypothetical protein
VAISLATLEWRNQRGLPVFRGPPPTESTHCHSIQHSFRACNPVFCVKSTCLCTECSSPVGAIGLPGPVPTLRPRRVSTRIKNVSGRKIVGLVFNADATEHWKWLHWNFDGARPVQNFGWNKPIKAGETKKLSWDRVNLDFQHGGGGAFVLTSVLFEDGSSWEEADDQASCKYVWFHNHKKFFAKPVQLPFR